MTITFLQKVQTFPSGVTFKQSKLAKSDAFVDE